MAGLDLIPALLDNKTQGIGRYTKLPLKGSKTHQPARTACQHVVRWHEGFLEQLVYRTKPHTPLLLCLRHWDMHMLRWVFLKVKKKKKVSAGTKIYQDIDCIQCFPGGSGGKESTCHAGDPGLIPGLGRCPGEGSGNPFQYSCLGNPMERGAWRT